MNIVFENLAHTFCIFIEIVYTRTPNIVCLAKTLTKYYF